MKSRRGQFRGYEAKEAEQASKRHYTCATTGRRCRTIGRVWRSLVRMGGGPSADAGKWPARRHGASPKEQRPFQPSPASCVQTQPPAQPIANYLLPHTPRILASLASTIFSSSMRITGLFSLGLQFSQRCLVCRSRLFIALQEDAYPLPNPIVRMAYSDLLLARSIYIWISILILPVNPQHKHRIVYSSHVRSLPFPGHSLASFLRMTDALTVHLKPVVPGASRFRHVEQIVRLAD